MLQFLRTMFNYLFGIQIFVTFRQVEYFEYFLVKMYVYLGIPLNLLVWFFSLLQMSNVNADVENRGKASSPLLKIYYHS